jgi:hypothetical protein
MIRVPGDSRESPGSRIIFYVQSYTVIENREQDKEQNNASIIKTNQRDAATRDAATHQFEKRNKNDYYKSMVCSAPAG